MGQLLEEGVFEGLGRTGPVVRVLLEQLEHEVLALFRKRVVERSLGVDLALLVELQDLVVVLALEEQLAEQSRIEKEQYMECMMTPTEKTSTLLLWRVSLEFRLAISGAT